VSGPAALESLGMTPRVAALIATHGVGLTPGRVVRSDRGFAFTMTADGVIIARPATRLLKSADEGGLPVVGDWVLLGGGEGEPLVEEVLPRGTAIVRRDPGKAARVQVLAANVDTVFVTHPIGDPPNLSRLERELALVWDSGADPVIVLTKSDLSADVEAAIADVSSIAPGVPVHAVSATSAFGLDAVREHLGVGETVVLIGPSGSGKSTLVNALAGQDVQATREVRASDGRGRHTTVSRELIALPGGGLIIDTPGLRAVGMWDSADGIDQAFSDIAELASACRFRDCTHSGEPGCAVEEAVSAGKLAERRLESYRALQAEVRYVNEQMDVRARQARKREDKLLGRAIKRYYRETGKG